MQSLYKALSFASRLLTVNLIRHRKYQVLRAKRGRVSEAMTVAQINCGHCSAAIEQDDRFCRECGSRQVVLSKRFSTVLLDQRRREERVNPLIKAEVLLVCALLTFMISAVFWARLPKTPAKKTAQKKAAPIVIPNAITSELDQLFHQAKSAPRAAIVQPKPITVVQPIVIVKTIEKPSASASTTSAPVSAQAEAQPQVKEVKVIKAPVIKENKSVADVTEYNKQLAEFFTRKHADGDTTDGAGQATTAEPPSYEEWLNAGKPGF
jgi:hypothetical protein